jgi:hypothetical protein
MPIVRESVDMLSCFSQLQSRSGHQQQPQRNFSDDEEDFVEHDLEDDDEDDEDDDDDDGEEDDDDEDEENVVNDDGGDEDDNDNENETSDSDQEENESEQAVNSESDPQEHEESNNSDYAKQGRQSRVTVNKRTAATVAATRQRSSKNKPNNKKRKKKNASKAKYRVVNCKKLNTTGASFQESDTCDPNRVSYFHAQSHSIINKSSENPDADYRPRMPNENNFVTISQKNELTSTIENSKSYFFFKFIHFYFIFLLASFSPG